jgi:hypothetical protein
MKTPFGLSKLLVVTAIVGLVLATFAIAQKTDTKATKDYTKWGITLDLGKASKDPMRVTLASLKAACADKASKDGHKKAYKVKFHDGTVPDWEDGDATVALTGVSVAKDIGGPGVSPVTDIKGPYSTQQLTFERATDLQAFTKLLVEP